MLKNILFILTYVFTAIFFVSVTIPLSNESCTVAVNSSSGEFYYTNSCSIKDHFIGNGKSKTYPLNFDYEKEIINYYDAKVVEISTNGKYVENYYYYSSTLPNFVNVNGKKVNVHVAVTKDNITVGYPIIYYGY